MRLGEYRGCAASEINGFDTLVSQILFTQQQFGSNTLAHLIQVFAACYRIKVAIIALRSAKGDMYVYACQPITIFSA
jgi:hypothetical protein